MWTNSAQRNAQRTLNRYSMRSYPYIGFSSDDFGLTRRNQFSSQYQPHLSCETTRHKRFRLPRRGRTSLFARRDGCDVQHLYCQRASPFTRLCQDANVVQVHPWHKSVTRFAARWDNNDNEGRRRILPTQCSM